MDFHKTRDKPNLSRIMMLQPNRPIKTFRANQKVLEAVGLSCGFRVSRWGIDTNRVKAQIANEIFD